MLCYCTLKNGKHSKDAKDLENLVVLWLTYYKNYLAAAFLGDGDQRPVIIVRNEDLLDQESCVVFLNYLKRCGLKGKHAWTLLDCDTKNRAGSLQAVIRIFFFHIIFNFFVFC